MTITEAREKIPNFDTFAESICRKCMVNDWYCPNYCDLLDKASTLDYERILKAYARNDGDLAKMCRYIIRRAK